MNKYFDKNDMFSSNKRIYEGYFTDSSASKGFGSRALEILLLLLQSILESNALRYVRVALVAVSLIGLIGVIGAVEMGTLGMGSALLIGTALVLVEYLCLKGRHRA
jgi:hypothetical protein